MEVRKYDAARGGGFCITSKKIVAVALSAAMCLGLSMTAFAAKNTGWTNTMWESEDYMREDIGPDDRNVLVGEDGSWLRRVTDKNGNSIAASLSQISKGTWESIKDEGKVQEIFKKAGYDVKEGMDFVPLATGTLTIDAGVPEGGATLNFGLADLGLGADTVKAGDVIYVMQETAPGSGVWDVFPATVSVLGGDYQVSVTVPRNGALVVVKAMSNGDIITLDRTTGEVIDRKPAGNTTGTQTGTSTTASAGTSPKTGEF